MSIAAPEGPGEGGRTHQPRPGVKCSVGWTLICVGLILILFLGNILSTIANGRPHSHPDEAITVIVGKQLDLSLNTNWKDHADLPFYFNGGNQYNFSAYIIYANALLDAALSVTGVDADDDLRLAGLRSISLLLNLVLMGLTALLARRLGADLVSSLAAAALVSITPSLFMDALYARPEVFVSCLSVAFILAALSENEIIKQAVAGFLCGVLFATKVTFILLLPCLLLLAVPQRRLAPYVRITGGFLIGAFIGMPQAFRHPWRYIEGIVFLVNEYRTGGYPHGLGKEAGILDRIWSGFLWTNQTLGAFFLALALLGFTITLIYRNTKGFILSAPFVFMIVYFWSSPQFFERNFSQSLVVTAALFAVGVSWVVNRAELLIAEWFGPVIFAVVLALAFWTPTRTSAKIFRGLMDEDAYEARVASQETAIEAKFNRRLTLLDWRTPPDPCSPNQLVEIYTAGARVPRWQVDKWEEIGRERSLFEKFVPSTLHTYVSRTTVWLRCKAATP